MRPKFLTLLCLWTLSASAPAAEIDPAAAPKCAAVVKNSELSLDLIRETVELGPAGDRSHAGSLCELVDVFLIGVDTQSPVRIDFLTAHEPTRSRMVVPVPQADFKDFLFNNLVPSGIPVLKIGGDGKKFRLGGGKGDAFDGYMSYDSAAGEAVIVEAEEDLAADVLPPITLEKGTDAAIRFESTPDGLAARRTRYVESKQKTLDDLRPRKGETKAEFALRKLLTGNRLDDYAQFYAEAAEAAASVSFDFEQSTAASKVFLKPHPGTPLADAMAAVEDRGSLFGGVASVGTTVCFGRLDWLISEDRKPRWDATLAAYRPVLIESLLENTADEAGTTAAVDAAVAHFEKVIDYGHLDGVADWSASPSGETLAVAFRTVDAGSLAAAVRALGSTTMADIVSEQSADGTSTFELVLDQARFDGFAESFGSREMTLRIGPEFSVLTAGVDRASRLEDVVSQVSDVDPDPDALVRFRGQLGRLLPAVRALQTEIVSSGSRALFDAAIAAGDDTVEFDLDCDGTEVIGGMTVNSALLDFAGRLLVRFSKENL